ncbi:MAG: hypothetical protein HQL90_14940 [Magnetococcales bacterium]|nr:hypothetical protein [Magnetococcales bacterium]
MKPLFPFAARQQQNHGVTAVIRRDNGVGLVHLLFESGEEQPILAHCRYQSENQPRIQQRLLTEWVQQWGLRNSRCVALLDRESYLLFPTDAPPLPQEEWGLNLRWKLADRIHYPPEQAVVEIFERPGSAHLGESGKIYLAVAHDAQVQREVDFLLQAGLSLAGLDILDLAAGRLTDALPEDGQGVGLLFWTDHGGVVQVRRNRTLFLARTIETKRQQIWQQPTTDPSTIPPLVDFPAALDELVTELRRTFDYYENHFLHPPLEQLFLMPVVDGDWNGAVPSSQRHDEQSLLATLSERLEMPVARLPLERLLRNTSLFTESDLIGCLPAIGAALDWGAGGTGGQRVNFYQPRFYPQRRLLPLSALLWSGLILWLGLLGSHWGLHAYLATKRSAWAQQAVATQAVTTADEEAASRRAEQGCVRAWEQLSLGAVQSETVPAAPLLELLASNHMAGIWITALDVSHGEAQVKLEGHLLPQQAPRLPHYLQTLARHPVMAGRTVQGVQLETKAAALPQAAPSTPHDQQAVLTFRVTFGREARP